VSNASNLANIALPDFGQSGQILTSTGNTTTPVFSAIPISDVNTNFLAGSGTVIEVGASNTSVKVNLLQCPDWKTGKTGKFLYQETAANRVSQQVALSGQFQRHIQYVVAQNLPLTGMDVLTTPTGAYPGTSDAHQGGVLLLDGRVFCVPMGSTVARIYDPVTDTLITPSGTYGGSSDHSGAILLPNGRVYCVPQNITIARIYDPATNTLSTPAGTFPAGAAKYAGGVLLSDGRVFCVPRQFATARIYDPVNNDLTTPSGTYNADPEGSRFGATLLLDGRVFMAPEAVPNATFVIYSPFNDTLTTPLGTYIPPSGFESCVLMPDGRVFCVPDESVVGQALIYNPTTNIITTPNMQGKDYTGGCLLPDGRVFCAPAGPTGGGTARVYDPISNTTTTPTGTVWTLAGYNGFIGAVLMQNGNVFMVPGWSTRAVIAKISYTGPNFSPALINGPFYNKL